MKQHEIKERAAYWLIEQEDPNFSAEQRSAFAAWLSEDPKHRDTYMALERAWHRTLILRQKPTSRDRLYRRVARRLMRVRNLKVHDAQRLTAGAFAVLRAAHHAPDFESCPWDSVAEVVARSITRDWLCFEYDASAKASNGCFPWAEGDHLQKVSGPCLLMFAFQTQHTAENGCVHSFATRRTQLVKLAFELNGLLEGAVSNLATCTRHVFTLRKVHGLSEDEIAGELNLSTDTVSQHLDEAAYHCAAHLVDTLPVEGQAVLFETLQTCHLAGKRKSLV
jgi:hypothetical protein